MRNQGSGGWDFVGVVQYVSACTFPHLSMGSTFLDRTLCMDLSRSTRSTRAASQITVSLAEGTQAVYSNSLLAFVAGSPVQTAMQLNAVVGVGTHPSGDVILNRDRALQFLATATPIDASLAEVTSINVFDFDGTLFNTPGPVEGKQAWWARHLQSWDRPGWVTHKESLEPPQVIQPGPVLQLFRHFQGLPNSLTVILTGRIEPLQPQLERVCADFGIAPDMLLLKSGKKEQTRIAKIASIERLLGNVSVQRDSLLTASVPSVACLLY